MDWVPYICPILTSTLAKLRHQIEITLKHGEWLEFGSKITIMASLLTLCVAILIHHRHVPLYSKPHTPGNRSYYSE